MINMSIDGRFREFLAEGAHPATTFMKPQKAQHLRLSLFISGCNAVDTVRT
jgi:hypothetical protein